MPEPFRPPARRGTPSAARLAARAVGTPRPPRGAAAVIPQAGPVQLASPVIQHPDGWYWLAEDGHQQFGPFETYELACADRDAWDEDAPAPGATLLEAEEELGISSWIDPETGEPAEGLSPPHLDAGER